MELANQICFHVNAFSNKFERITTKACIDIQHNTIVFLFFVYHERLLVAHMLKNAIKEIISDMKKYPFTTL